MLRAGFLHQTRGLDHHGMTLLPQLGRRPYHPLLYLFNAMHHLYLPTYGPRKACREATLLDFSRTSRHGHITYGPGWTVIWTRGAQNAGVLYRGLAGQVALIPACDVGAACERFLPRRRLDRGRTLLPVVMGVAGPSCLVGDCAGRRDSVHSMTPMRAGKTCQPQFRKRSRQKQGSQRSVPNHFRFLFAIRIVLLGRGVVKGLVQNICKLMVGSYLQFSEKSAKSSTPSSFAIIKISRRRYRLGVRTEDSQSSNPGSIPGSATKPST